MRSTALISYHLGTALPKSPTHLRIIPNDKPKAKRANRTMNKMLSQFSVHTQEEIVLFEVLFNMAYPEYFGRLKEAYPDFTPTQKVLFAYCRLNLTLKIMARNMGYTIEEVKRQLFCICRKYEMTLPELQAKAANL